MFDAESNELRGSLHGPDGWHLSLVGDRALAGRIRDGIAEQCARGCPASAPRD
jgi:hypothetical protein